ncbi:MAG: HupE/UreJ family protein, partial [Pseudomonadota bacterium]
GLPDDDIPLALFAFNIGVEVGQLLFIAALILCARLLSRLYPRWAAWAAAEQGPVLQLTSHAIGGLGAFWVLDRAAGF